MVLGLAVLALALIATPAMAINLFTINDSIGEGVSGSGLFIPAFIVSTDSNSIAGPAGVNGIYIPYLGSMNPCTSTIDNLAGGSCARWGEASIVAWANGVYYDPRFGTPFIPPSGDHHRTGYRLLMQPSFSGGQWNSGFASLAERFPFFPEVGQPGAGGDIGLALANSSQLSGLVGILAFLDGHGEPLTTGKFPRYWPHERQAWTDTLMVKYTAGSGATAVLGQSGSSLEQSLRTGGGFARNATYIRWRAMSNVDGHFAMDQDGSAATENNSSGCGGPWCEFYVTEDVNGNTHLFVVKGADGDTDTSTDGTVYEITQSTRINTLAAADPDGAGTLEGGMVLQTVTLNNIEKLPFVVDDRLAQNLWNVAFEENVPTDPGDDVNDVFQQQLISQIQVVSGPNFHSEEGADPYAWVICGTRGHEYGEADCVEESNDGKGAIDAGGHVFAIVYYPGGGYTLGESPITRFGNDLNPRRVGNTLYPQGLTDGLDPDVEQDVNAFVECTTGASAQEGTPLFPTSDCESNPGPDDMYGTVDDGTIYYKEAIENGLRGWIRETNGHAFSFLGADMDGDHNGTSPANFGLTQLLQQRDNTLGYLMSCINCSPHDPPSGQDTVTYNFQWPGLPEIIGVSHPPVNNPVLPVLP
jgi:hypothetical protein